jgi:hypothetical protein
MTHYDEEVPTVSALITTSRNKTPAANTFDYPKPLGLQKSV